MNHEMRKARMGSSAAAQDDPSIPVIQPGIASCNIPTDAQEPTDPVVRLVTSTWIRHCSHRPRDEKRGPNDNVQPEDLRPVFRLPPYVTYPRERSKLMQDISYSQGD